MSFNWKKTLATVAPGIAAALGGPLTGIAVQTACAALGITDQDASEQALQGAVMTGGADALLRLKEGERQFQLDLKRLDVDIQRIDASDRGSARELGKARGIMPQAILSVIFVLAFAACLYALFSGNTDIPDSMKQVATLLIGILSAGLTQIMNFWFGSSAGSKEKTLQLQGSPTL